VKYIIPVVYPDTIHIIKVEEIADRIVLKSFYYSEKMWGSRLQNTGSNPLKLKKNPLYQKS
jgi:hypothetical protein